MQLQGTTALVTGASGGLGEAIARELRRSGARLILHGRREPELNALAAAVDGTVVVADLAERSQLDELIEQCRDVDVLIANAGIGGDGRIVDGDAADVDRVIEVNLTANIHLARELGAGMVVRGRGHMVFIGSLAGKATGAGTALYSASKFGLRGFTIALRDELGPEGVGVSLVQPGFVRDAGMFADGGADLPPGVGTSSPEEVATAVRRAIEKNKGMVTIAPPLVRGAADLANVAPTLTMWIANHTPAGKVKQVTDT